MGSGQGDQAGGVGAKPPEEAALPGLRYTLVEAEERVDGPSGRALRQTG